MMNFLEHKAKCKPSILKITELYSQMFIPAMASAEYPKPLTGLHVPDTLHSDFHSVIHSCESVTDSIKVHS